MPFGNEGTQVWGGEVASVDVVEREAYLGTQGGGNKLSTSDRRFWEVQIKPEMLNQEEKEYLKEYGEFKEHQLRLGAGL